MVEQHLRTEDTFCKYIILKYIFILNEPTCYKNSATTG